MFRISSAALLAALLVTPVLAQIDPIGRIHRSAKPVAQVAAYAVPRLDRPTIAAEDVNRAANGQPARYAIPNQVAISPSTHGTWERLDKTWSLWRLRIQAPDASHVNLGFRQFSMPGNARMQVYASDYSYIVRPFTAADHQPTGELWTPIVRGDEIVCEVYVQAADIPQMRLQLVHIGSGYRFFGAGPSAMVVANGSGSCNVDVACSQGAPWANEIPAIAAISTGGSIFCTGAMINNTAQDGRNFFLTAYHCGVNSGSAPSLVCYWNYEAATCGGSSAPLNMFTVGATWRAGYSASDFTLVELNSTPNAAWGVTYAGWSRASGGTSSAVGIHHPSGDKKKISFENNPTSVTSYGGTSSPGDGTHIRVTDWDLGTTEPGSSGSPLFNPNHQIIGQLHGGSAACGNNLSDWYGALQRSWTGGGSNSSRLSNWLDPTNSGAVSINTLGAGGIAAALPFGTGCYASQESYFEEFSGGTFDLSGTATTAVNIRMTPITSGSTVTGYTVDFGPSLWQTPTSPDLGLGDDALSTQVLPFALSYPGGQTQVVRFCTNGFVWLNGSSTSTDYSPTTAEFINNPARLAPCWVDLNPTAGGSCHYQVVGGVAYFTWNDVPAYTAGPAGAGNSIQIAIFPNGQIDYRYLQVPNQPNAAIVGFARGNSSTPAASDLSVDLPLTVGSNASGLGLEALNAPKLGTTVFMRTNNIVDPPFTFGLFLESAQQSATGLDLASIGAPGCRLYAINPIISVFLPTTTSYVRQWPGPGQPIPNNSSLIGQSFFVQSAAWMPFSSTSVNAFDLLTSNGVELVLGN